MDADSFNLPCHISQSSCQHIHPRAWRGQLDAALHAFDGDDAGVAHGVALAGDGELIRGSGLNVQCMGRYGGHHK